MFDKIKNKQDNKEDAKKHYYDLQKKVEHYIDINYTETDNDSPKRFLKAAGIFEKKAVRCESAQSFECDSAMEEPPALNFEAAPKEKSIGLVPREKALGAAVSAKSIEAAVANTGETFAQKLMILIEEHGMSNAQFYTKANIRKSHFSKIKNNPDYQPKKSTVFACAIALELNSDSARDLLARAGYAISPSSKFDLAIQFFIENEVYDIFKIDTVLYDMELPLIGDYD